jgi:hypothetical protein
MFPSLVSLWEVTFYFLQAALQVLWLSVAVFSVHPISRHLQNVCSIYIYFSYYVLQESRGLNIAPLVVTPCVIYNSPGFTIKMFHKFLTQFCFLLSVELYAVWGIHSLKANFFSILCIYPSHFLLAEINSFCASPTKSLSSLQI